MKWFWWRTQASANNQLARAVEKDFFRQWKRVSASTKCIWPKDYYKTKPSMVELGENLRENDLNQSWDYASTPDWLFPRRRSPKQDSSFGIAHSSYLHAVGAPLGCINEEYLVLLKIISLRHLQIAQHNAAVPTNMTRLSLSLKFESQFPSIWETDLGGVNLVAK